MIRVTPLRGYVQRSSEISSTYFFTSYYIFVPFPLSTSVNSTFFTCFSLPLFLSLRVTPCDILINSDQFPSSRCDACLARSLDGLPSLPSTSRSQPAASSRMLCSLLGTASTYILLILFILDRFFCAYVIAYI